MSEIFRIYLNAAMASEMDRKALRGAWEAALRESGGMPAQYPCITIRQVGQRVTVAGMATPPREPTP